MGCVRHSRAEAPWPLPWSPPSLSGATRRTQGGDEQQPRAANQLAPTGPRRVLFDLSTCFSLGRKTLHICSCSSLKNFFQDQEVTRERNAELLFPWVSTHINPFSPLLKRFGKDRSSSKWNHFHIAPMLMGRKDVEKGKT